MDINGKRLDVIAWHYPEEKRIETKGEVGVSPYSARGKVEREREERGMWEAIVVTPEYGYLPLETWKRVRDNVSGTISVATGSIVKPSEVQVHMIAPISEQRKCPKCGTAIFIDFGVCQVCGTKLH